MLSGTAGAGLGESELVGKIGPDSDKVETEITDHHFRRKEMNMKVISVTELRKYLRDIAEAGSCLDTLLNQQDILIADIPAPEKKVRKKRVKKEKPSITTTESKEKPHRGRTRGSKNQGGALTPFGEPKLRPGETPT